MDPLHFCDTTWTRVKGSSTVIDPRHPLEVLSEITHIPEVDVALFDRETLQAELRRRRACRANHLVAPVQKATNQIGSHKARTPCDQYTLSQI